MDEKGKFKKLLFITTILFLFAFIVNANTISCNIQNSACGSGEVTVLKLEKSTNAHAALPSESYPYRVCCSGFSGLGNSCSGNHAVLLKLYSTANSHVEENSQSLYTNNACLSISDPGGEVSVNYRDTTCDEGYTPILSLTKSLTNAHVGSSSSYTRKVCVEVSPGNLIADIVNASGTPVSSPTVAFSSLPFSFSSQNSTGVLGTTNQKIRVANTTSESSWSLSIAGNPTDKWVDGGKNYYYNNTSGLGQLTIGTFSISSVSSSLGCSTTGLSTLSATTSFSNGVSDSIELLNASSADTGCYWDITGIPLKQAIPENQAPGDYSLNLTLTAVAY